MPRCRAYNSTRSPIHDHCSDVRPLSLLVQRFEESIGGRAYLIEVAAVDPTRWRACIVKAPGVPTALMPFYGATADDAACRLRQWLTRAYERAATPSGQS